jgi:hypothetical protein
VTRAGGVAAGILLAVAAACSGKVTLVGYGKLAAALPAVDGWTREAPSGAEIKLPAPASHVSAGYTRGTSHIDLEITDTGGAKEYLEALSTVAGTAFKQENATGYTKGTTFGGFPALESWNSSDRTSDLTVVIEKRFLVHAAGVNLDRIETLRDFVTKINGGGVLPKLEIR